MLPKDRNVSTMSDHNIPFRPSVMPTPRLLFSQKVRLGVPMTVPSHQKDILSVVVIVALLNLAYFGVEFGVASVIGSVSLFADNVNFL